MTDGPPTRQGAVAHLAPGCFWGCAAQLGIALVIGWSVAITASMAALLMPGLAAALVPVVMFVRTVRRPDAPHREAALSLYALWFLGSLLLAWTLALTAGI